MKKIIYCILVVLFSFTILSAQEKNENSWKYLEYDTTMYSHLEGLTKNERIEQCRDWLKYAIINSYHFSDKVNFELLYDFNPLRYGFLDKLSDYEYGEYRYFIVGDTAYAIIPYKTKFSI